MQLQDYLTTLRRRWRTIVAAGHRLILLFGMYMIAKSDPTYAASTELFVAPGSVPGTAELVQGSTFYEDGVKTYALIVNSAIVLQPVIDDLGLDLDRPSYRDEGVGDRSGRHRAPAHHRHRRRPGGRRRDRQRRRRTVRRGRSALESVEQTNCQPVVRVTIVQPAVEPKVPEYAPNKRLILVLSGMMGLAIGFAIAVVRELLDNRVRTEAHLRAITDTIVGKIRRRIAAGQHHRGIEPRRTGSCVRTSSSSTCPRSTTRSS